MSKAEQSYPYFLQNYANLKTHFDEQYENYTSNKKGDSFAEFAQALIPYTNLGRNFEKPELGQKSHDGGVDLTARNSNNQVLLTQSKFSLKDKADFGTIISKFQDFYQKHYTSSVGPLFAYSGIEMGLTPQVLFQIVTLHDLTRIKKLFEESGFSSLAFYQQLVRNNQIEIIDGNVILQLLRTAYRKTNFLPSNFDLEFATEPIAWGNVYVGVVSSNQLKKLFDEYGDALFFENLRDFLSSTEVNQDIVKTAKEQPDQLLARNNGIVLKSSRVKKYPNRPVLQLEEGSVVNGCQTTLSIVLNTVQECYVVAKVVQTSTDKAWELTRSANFQNQVKRFDLELAQFLRPQIVKKAASQAGLGLHGNQSASAIIDAISTEEIVYEELRALFIGIFSKAPSNIFDTEYTDLMSNVMALFYKDDPEGIILFNYLFTIFQAANRSSTGIIKKLQKRSDMASQDTYRRFFKEGKFSYRAFFALLAASAVSDIDISTVTSNEQTRYDLVNNFLRETVKIIENEPKKFDRYYHYTVQAVSASVKGRDKAEIQQYLWKFMRNTDFNIFLERVHQTSDLAMSLADEG